MRLAERLKTTGEARRKLTWAVGCSHGLRRYGAHCGKRILDPMIELADQQPL